MPNVLITLTHIVHICVILRIRQWIKQVLSELTPNSALVSATITCPPNYHKTRGGASAICTSGEQKSRNTLTFTKRQSQATPSPYTPPFRDWTIARKTDVRVTCFWRMFTNRPQSGAASKADGNERIHFLGLPPSASSLLGFFFTKRHFGSECRWLSSHWNVLCLLLCEV